MDGGNQGDLLSSPLTYFQFGFQTEQVALKGYCESKIDHLILGGGGLLDNDYYHSEISEASNNTLGQKIAWGTGYNFHSYPFGFNVDLSNRTNLYKRELKGFIRRLTNSKQSSWAQNLLGHRLNKPRFLEDFDLVGIRDYDPDSDCWTPCASCFLPQLDEGRRSTPSQKTIVIDHPTFMRISQNRFPQLHNTETSASDLIKLIASAETVVTSSYHALYWATLMNRKTVCIPWSTKFLGLKWPTEICFDGDGLLYSIKKAKNHPNALEEARNANLAFASKAAQLLATEISLLRPEQIRDNSERWNR